MDPLDTASVDAAAELAEPADGAPTRRRLGRATLEDIAQAAGVSLSTVDRLLNARAPVRGDTAERVRAAAERLGFRASGVIAQRVNQQRPRRRLGFLLQRPASGFYRALGRALTDAVEQAPDIRGQAHIAYLDDLSAEAVAERMLALGAEVDALAVVAADHPRVHAAMASLQARGVPVFALVSELSSPLCAGFVGPDSRKVGRSAAWFIAGLARTPGPVAIFVGTHRFQCQELSEMSFRSYMREHAPGFEVLEPVMTLDSPTMAEEAMRSLLLRHPDLRGFYVDGGGIEGVLRALPAARAEGLLAEQTEPLIGVAHDLTPDTLAGLQTGALHAVLSMPRPQLAQGLVRGMVDALASAESATGPSHRPLRLILPLETWTPESV
ncbi:LacI family DNA-binding transcriptional regulator [Ideonella livida]|uniref:LacI family transcriptional regulator n=1 Tax=Ideonella livida TaxID=2707176 RepID=A0A7C9TJF6_9BURK|nr:LacI family DNA-binding transcriptional regulator [Ideonella livida]NDY92059.1 LacI family transcriptional regulator [Ideonella livida]